MTSATGHQRRDAVLAGLDTVIKPALTLCLEVHADPELSGAEIRTAGRLARRLESDGYAVTEGVGGHGVVAVLSNGPGPAVMVRTELDALPVRERTGLAYASTAVAEDAEGRTVPVMHACGHDLHLAAAAGAASLLARARERWRGTVIVLGQPAEETLSGARAMLDDGLYTRFPRPDVVLAQHTSPLPAGMVAHANGGPVTAGSVTLRVVLHGRGGHAGTPWLTIDPVVTAAATVLRLQTVVSRETAPAEQVVLTVGSLHAGTGANTVPDRAELGITVRALSPAALDRVTAAVERIVVAESAASGSARAPEITVVSRSPVNIPDPGASAVVRTAHEALFGPERVAPWVPSMATEDFPLLAEGGVATAYWILGIVGPRQWAEARGASAAEKLAALPANHAPEFAPDLRTALPAGIRAMTAAALAHLADPGGDAAPR